jgi:ABC-type multidrug transport system ATPase subunit
MCDRVGVLDRGRLLAVGRPADFGADVTRDSFRAWLGGDMIPVLSQLVAQGLLSDATELPGRDGVWREFSLIVPGGHESAAEIVRALVHGGVDVARIERIPVSVADIIERVLAQQPARAADV